MGVPLVSNVYPFDDNGVPDGRALLPARAQIRLLSLIDTLTTAAMWLTVPTLAAEYR